MDTSKQNGSVGSGSGGSDSMTSRTTSMTGTTASMDARTVTASGVPAQPITQVPRERVEWLRRYGESLKPPETPW